MPFPKLIFHYVGGVTLKTTTKPLIDAVKFILETPRFANHPPYKMVVESTSKTFYFDENLFNGFATGEISQNELILQTECDGLFRNKLDAELAEHNIVDSGSLWKLKNKFLHLIDDDRFVRVPFPDDNFTEV